MKFLARRILFFSPFHLLAGSKGRPVVRPCDITSSVCEGSVFAVRRGGRQQSCLGFRDSLKTYSCCVSRC